MLLKKLHVTPANIAIFSSHIHFILKIFTNFEPVKK